MLHEFTCKVVLQFGHLLTPHLVQWQGMPMCLTSLDALTEPSFTRSMKTRSAFMYAFTTCSRRRRQQHSPPRQRGKGNKPRSGQFPRACVCFRILQSYSIVRVTRMKSVLLVNRTTIVHSTRFPLRRRYLGRGVAQGQIPMALRAATKGRKTHQPMKF